jgi:hypothetical protein
MRPECHGMKMAPDTRREDSVGSVFISYRCRTCGRRKEVKIRGG